MFDLIKEAFTMEARMEGGSIEAASYHNLYARMKRKILAKLRGGCSRRAAATLASYLTDLADSYTRYLKAKLERLS